MPRLRRAAGCAGCGVCTYLEVTAPVGKEMGGIRFEADGRVTIDHRHARLRPGPRLGLRPGAARPAGHPVRARSTCSRETATSCCMAAAPAARARSWRAARPSPRPRLQVIEKGRKLAGHVLEAAAEDIGFAARAASGSPAPTARSTCIELAARVRGMALPADLPQSLDAALVADTPPSAFPNGCHVAEVEIDPETGVVSLSATSRSTTSARWSTRCWSRARCMAASPRASARRCYEQHGLRRSGQLLTGSFMDYNLPRADNLPSFELGLPHRAGDRPTRWASRAAARPASPPPCRRS